MSKDRSPRSLLGKPVGLRALFIYPSAVWLIVICAWPLDRIFDLCLCLCVCWCRLLIHVTAERYERSADPISNETVKMINLAGIDQNPVCPYCSVMSVAQVSIMFIGNSRCPVCCTRPGD